MDAIFENLFTLELLENPIFIALIIGILRSVLGYLGNKLEDSKTKFDAGKLGATLVWYETFLVMLSQHPQLGVEGAIVIGAILDVVRTASKFLKS